MSFFNQVGGMMQREGQLSEKITHLYLTEKGVKKLQDLQPTGRAFDIMAAVKKLQPATPKEIAEEIRWPEYKVEYIIRELMADELVKKV